MDKRAIPNMLTVGRMAIIPVFVGCYWLPAPCNHVAMLVLFLLASVTDWADGYLARKWSATSDMGRMLDPVADKLLVAAALIILAVQGIAPMLAVLLILLRELMVSGLRESLAGKGFSLPVTFIAKCKTALQMVAIILLIALPLLQMPELWEWFRGVLWIAALLTAYTGAEYLLQAIRFLRLKA